MIMMIRVPWVSLLALLFGAALFAAGQTAGPDAEPGGIQIRSLTDRGQVQYDLQRGVFVFTNGVQITYSNAVLNAESGTADLKSGALEAAGDVSLTRDDHLWRGDKLRYNFLTGAMAGEGFRSSHEPFFVSGESADADRTNSVYTATNALVTTDDVADPSYWIRAREIRVVPGEYLEARHATVLLGPVPVLYLPYFKKRLSDVGSNWTFSPGYRSLYGPYLLTTYTWYGLEQLETDLHLDYRQERGVGLGADARYDLGKLGAGSVGGYYLKDEEPGIDAAGRPIPDDRHRLQWMHGVRPRTNMLARVVVQEQSDALVLRDFFESDYRSNVQPDSFLEVDQQFANFGVNLLARPQINDFFGTVERLPDLKLTGYRQQIGDSPLYYENESSAGWFRRQFANGSQPDYGASRMDSFHQVVLPQTYFGWLNVMPRLGGRYTHYGETDGFGSELTSQHRWVLNTGAEVSFKASRIWRNAHHRFFDVNELRHIVQPSVNYAYVPSPNKLPAQLPQFDRDLPSLRLLPIDFPDDRNIDAIDSRNVLRLGLRNKLQTKRDGAVDNLVNWAVFADWRLNPNPGEDTMSDLYSDLDLKPRSWLTLNSEIQYGLNRFQMRQANHTITLLPNNDWSWSFGHRYLQDEVLPGVGNNLFSSVFYYRFNENWGARLAHHFEARDGVMEEQYYTLYRDLRSWTAALTLRLRDSRDGRDDFTIGVTFSLKAFPRFNLGDDRSRPSLLLGG